MADSKEGSDMAQRRHGMVVCAAAAALLAVVAAPGAVSAADAGGGAIAGTVSWSPAAPLQLGTSCTQEQFSLQATGTLAMSFGGATYGGLVDVSSGLSTSWFSCQSLAQDAGTLDVSITGSTGVGSLACGDGAALPALYLRWGTILLIVLHGTCNVSGVATPLLDIDILGVLTPTSVSGGAVTSAAYTASVVAVPSE